MVCAVPILISIERDRKEYGSGPYPFPPLRKAGFSLRRPNGNAATPAGRPYGVQRQTIPHHMPDTAKSGRIKERFRLSR